MFRDGEAAGLGNRGDAQGGKRTRRERRGLRPTLEHACRKAWFGEAWQLEVWGACRTLIFEARLTSSRAEAREGRKSVDGKCAEACQCDSCGIMGRGISSL